MTIPNLPNAACRHPDHDPDWWHTPSKPGAKHPAAVANTRRAQAICRSCVVVSECLLFALDHPEVQGIWGGLTEQERAARARFGRVTG